MIRRMLVPFVLAAFVLVSFSGCDILADMFGLDFSGGGTPDLLVQSVSVSDDGSTLDIVFANNGDESVSGVEFVVVLSTDQQWSPTIDYEVHGEGGLSIGAWSTQRRSIDTAGVDISNIPDGTYHIGVVVDPDDWVFEQNEGNNAKFTQETFEISSTEADPYEPNDSMGEAAEIWVSDANADNSIYANITPGDQDWFFFYAEADVVYEIGTASAGYGYDLDTYLSVYDEYGGSLGSDDDGGSGFYSLITDFSVGYGQYVYILVEGLYSTGEGEYILDVFDMTGLLDVSIQSLDTVTVE